MQPLISILLPIYNGEKHLRDTIQSLLQQSFQNFEILACIDGSNDSSEDILESCSDDRIKLFKNPTNMGLGRTLNKLVFQSSTSSQYFALAEQDDVYYPDRLEKQLKIFETKLDVGLVSGIANFFDGEKVTGQFPGILVSGAQYPQGEEMFLLNYINQVKVVNSCMMIRKSVHIENGLYFTMHLPSISVDWTYILRFCLISEIFGLNEPLVKLRRSKSHDSLTSNKQKVNASTRELLRSMKFEFPELINRSTYKTSVTTQDIFELKGTVKSKIPTKLLLAWMKNPFDSRWIELIEFYLE